MVTRLVKTTIQSHCPSSLRTEFVVTRFIDDEGHDYGRQRQDVLSQCSRLGIKGTPDASYGKLLRIHDIDNPNGFEWKNANPWRK